MTETVRGTDELVKRLDGLVGETSDERITAGVKTTLCELIKNNVIRLPDSFRKSCSDHYARRLLYRSDEFGYEVLAMTWGPGQGTPVHDHAGYWCVEGVLEGDLEVVQYDLVEETGDRCRFQKRTMVYAGVGSAGTLIPPFDYHTISNCSDQPAITIHIYGGSLTECSVFEPTDDGWHQRKSRQLTLVEK